MHPGVTDYPDEPARHAAANPLDLRAIAANFDFLTAIPLDLEEVIEPALSLAEEDRQRGNIGVLDWREHVRREAFRLQGHRGRFFERQGEHGVTINQELLGLSGLFGLLLGPFWPRSGHRFLARFHGKLNEKPREEVEISVFFSSGSRIFDPHQHLVSILTDVSGNDRP